MPLGIIASLSGLIMLMVQLGKTLQNRPVAKQYQPVRREQPVNQNSQNDQTNNKPNATNLNFKTVTSPGHIDPREYGPQTEPYNPQKAATAKGWQDYFNSFGQRTPENLKYNVDDPYSWVKNKFSAPNTTYYTADPTDNGGYNFRFYENGQEVEKPTPGFKPVYYPLNSIDERVSANPRYHTDAAREGLNRIMSINPGNNPYYPAEYTGVPSAKYPYRNINPNMKLPANSINKTSVVPNNEQLKGVMDDFYIRKLLESKMSKPKNISAEQLAANRFGVNVPSQVNEEQKARNLFGLNNNNTPSGSSQKPKRGRTPNYTVEYNNGQSSTTQPTVQPTPSKKPVKPNSTLASGNQKKPKKPQEVKNPAEIVNGYEQ